MDVPRWPDIEQVLVRRLPERVRPHLVDGEVLDAGTYAHDVEGKIFLQVTVLGGADDTVTDTTRVDVDVFAPTRARAMEVAYSVREVMLGMIGSAEPDGSDLLDYIGTAVRPTPVQYRNPNVYRSMVGFNVSARLQ